MEALLIWPRVKGKIARPFWGYTRAGLDSARVRCVGCQLGSTLILDAGNFQSRHINLTGFQKFDETAFFGQLVGNPMGGKLPALWRDFGSNNFSLGIQWLNLTPPDPWSNLTQLRVWPNSFCHSDSTFLQLRHIPNSQPPKIRLWDSSSSSEGGGGRGHRLSERPSLQISRFLNPTHPESPLLVPYPCLLHLCMRERWDFWRSPHQNY